MSDDKPIIKAGIGVMIFKDGKILLGKRKNAHGGGDYAFPGGHLEYMESFADCARRETREETGMEIANIRFQYLYNLKEYAPKHYVHIGLTADWLAGEPQNSEPEKCEGWDWYDPKQLPEPMFAPARLGVEAFFTGHNYFDQ
jgi:8-oxo-dGTP diphosphatase